MQEGQVVALEPGTDTDAVRRHITGVQRWWLLHVLEVCTASAEQLPRLSERAGAQVQEGEVFYRGEWSEPDGCITGRSEPVYVEAGADLDECTDADRVVGIDGAIAFPVQLLAAPVALKHFSKGQYQMSRDDAKWLKLHKRVLEGVIAPRDGAYLICITLHCAQYQPAAYIYKACPCLHTPPPVNHSCRTDPHSVCIRTEALLGDP